MIPDINIFRTVIERYNGQGYKADDYLLFQRAEEFYKSKSSTELTGIINYLRTQAISKNLIGLAEELACILKAETAVISDPRSNPDIRAAPQVALPRPVAVYVFSEKGIESETSSPAAIKNDEVYAPDFLIF